LIDNEILRLRDYGFKSGDTLDYLNEDGDTKLILRDIGVFGTYPHVIGRDWLLGRHEGSDLKEVRDVI